MREHVFCNVVSLDGQFLVRVDGRLFPPLDSSGPSRPSLTPLSLRCSPPLFHSSVSLPQLGLSSTVHSLASSLAQVQRMGVPQGSLLSAAFCSLHYGAYEHAILARYLPHRAAIAEAEPELTAPPRELHLQLRLIDDTLHVRTAVAASGVSPSAAAPTAAAAHHPSRDQQLRSFGSILNMSKMRAYPAASTSGAAALSSDAAAASSSEAAAASSAAASSIASSIASPVAPPSPPPPPPREPPPPGICTDASGRRYFPWCGWLIDVQTLEVRPHLARARLLLAKERHPRRGTVPLARWVALACKALKPRLHRAFVDPQVRRSAQRETHLCICAPDGRRGALTAPHRPESARAA